MLQKSSHLVVQPLYQTVRQTSPQVQKIRQKTTTRKIPAVEVLLQPNQFQLVQAEVVRVTRPEVVVRAPPAVNHIVQIQNHPQGSPLQKVVLRVVENKKKLPKKKVTNFKNLKEKKNFLNLPLPIRKLKYSFYNHRRYITSKEVASYFIVFSV